MSDRPPRPPRGLVVLVEGPPPVTQLGRALRKLRRKMEQEGVLRELHRHLHHLKPSALRRRKSRLAAQLRARSKRRQRAASTARHAPPG
jgi:ribosomal protein S21